MTDHKDTVKNLIKQFLTVLLFCSLGSIQSAWSAECYEAVIESPTPFLGNHEEIFKLSDGSIWEVTYEYEYLYEYSPTVTICPSRGLLLINGTYLNVSLITKPNNSASIGTSSWELFEETNLSGQISGTIEQGRIFKTVSDNIYEVTGITLQLVLQLQPKVMVLRRGDVYKLIVDGFDEPLICTKLN